MSTITVTISVDDTVHSETRISDASLTREVLERTATRTHGRMIVSLNAELNPDPVYNLRDTAHQHPRTRAR